MKGGTAITPSEPEPSNEGNDSGRERRDNKTDEREQYILTKTLAQIYEEKKALNKKENGNKGQTILQAFVLTSILAVANVLMVIGSEFTENAIFVEVGTFILVLILLTQFNSLRGEINATTEDPDMSEAHRKLVGDYYFPHLRSELLSKVFDVRKNTIDKLFEKLGTFSNTWLVVTGGVASSLLVEIFKSSSIELYPSIAIIVSALLLWDIAQNLYGILDYELVKKTKDLAYWWIALPRAPPRPDDFGDNGF